MTNKDEDKKIKKPVEEKKAEELDQAELDKAVGGVRPAGGWVSNNAPPIPSN